MAAYLLHRGLQTLHLRINAAQHNAIIIAQRLMQHQSVERVFHPSLPECDPLNLVGEQMSGPGPLMSFLVTGGREMASQLMQRLNLINPAVSLGSVDTLIQHPSGLTHRNSTAEGRVTSGITENMLRLSVGIENVEDLWMDLEQALDAIQ